MEWNEVVILDTCLDGFVGMEWKSLPSPPYPSKILYLLSPKLGEHERSGLYSKDNYIFFILLKL